MDKLSAETHAMLKKAFAKQTIPEQDSPHYNDFFDAWGDLSAMLAEDVVDPKAPAARRQVGALTGIWDAICCDGLLVGVAVNQPESVELARQGAAAMGLSALKPLLDRVAACVPAEVIAIEDVGERLAWYQADEREAMTSELESLEEEIQDEEPATAMMVGCIKRVLAEPALFFEK